MRLCVLGHLYALSSSVARKLHYNCLHGTPHNMMCVPALQTLLIYISHDSSAYVVVSAILATHHRI